MLPSIAHPIRILASAPLQYSGIHRDMPKPLGTQCPNSTSLSRVCQEHSSKNPREIVSSVLFGPKNNKKLSSHSPSKVRISVSCKSRTFLLTIALLYCCRSALAIQWLTSASASGAGGTGSVVSAILYWLQIVCELLLAMMSLMGCVSLSVDRRWLLLRSFLCCCGLKASHWFFSKFVCGVARTKFV